MERVLVSVCVGVSPAADADTFPCVDGLDIDYNKFTTTVDGVPTATRFLNFTVAASFVCRQPVLQCVVIVLLGGAPPVAFGAGGPVDGDAYSCAVRESFPKGQGPVPSGAVIITSVFTLSHEQSANYHGFFIT